MKPCALGKRCCRLRDVLTILEPDFLQREVLIEELAGGVVVLDGKARAGNAVVLGRLFDERQFRLDAGVAEIADADLDRVGREHGAGRDAEADRNDQPSDHGSSLTGLLAAWKAVGLNHDRIVLACNPILCGGGITPFQPFRRSACQRR